MNRQIEASTNNRMELMAAIAGLEALKAPCNVTLYSDSKYLVDAFRLKWIDSWIAKDFKRGKNEPVKNPDLWKRLLKAKENPIPVINPYNKGKSKDKFKGSKFKYSNCFY